jgi:hypothetical protein
VRTFPAIVRVPGDRDRTPERRRPNVPDVDDLKDTKNFHLGVPCKQEAFFLKGANALD